MIISLELISTLNVSTSVKVKFIIFCVLFDRYASSAFDSIGIWKKMKTNARDWRKRGTDVNKCRCAVVQGHRF